MSAPDNLGKQFVLLHRGVPDWSAHDVATGERYPSAEAWYAQHSEDHPGFGEWWDHDESLAKFYGMGIGTGRPPDSGVVVSATFPRSSTRVPGGQHEGTLVIPGTSGIVRHVRAVTKAGEIVELPHRPGFRVKA